MKQGLVSPAFGVFPFAEKTGTFVCEEALVGLDGALAFAVKGVDGEGELGEAGGLGVGDGGAEVDGVELAPVDGGGAHGAGLGGGVHDAAGEVDGAEGFGGVLDADDLGVGGGVGAVPDLVVALADEGVVADDDGSEGGLAFGDGGAGLFDGEAHEAGVVGGVVGLRHGGKRIRAGLGARLRGCGGA